MKKRYDTPRMRVMHVEGDNAIMQGSKVYTDDPQNPRDALSRDVIYDEEFDEW